MSKYYEDILIESMRLHSADDRSKKKRLTESAQDMWVLVPSQNRYDDPIDVMKFAKKYGVFDSMSKAFDKAEELAPDRWDAFVPVRLSESLTEARNPENDEVNATIRKWANSDRNRLSKKDQETLDKYGISLEDEDSALKQHAPKEIKKYYSGKRMVGSNPQIQMGLTKNLVKSKHDDFDSANYLNKERKTDWKTYRDNIFKNAENHAKKKKNESLSLKEEKNKEVDEYISKLLNKIKDSGLQQVIRDAIFRGNVDKKFLLDTICQNMPEQKKEIEKLGLKESLSLKEGLRGSNLWGELFDEAREHIYDAICDTLNSIDWLDDDEIDIDDIFISELSQQLASELCDTVDDMFGEIITR